MPLQNEQAGNLHHHLGDGLMYASGLTGAAGEVFGQAMLIPCEALDILELGCFGVTITTSGGGNVKARAAYRLVTDTGSPYAIAGTPIVTTTVSVDANNERAVELYEPGKYRLTKANGAIVKGIFGASDQTITGILLHVYLFGTATITAATNMAVWCRFRAYNDLNT